LKKNFPRRGLLMPPESGKTGQLRSLGEVFVAAWMKQRSLGKLLGELWGYDWENEWDIRH
jgi:hypothetical protein